MIVLGNKGLVTLGNKSNIVFGNGTKTLLPYALITIDHTQVSSTQANFPVLISGTYPTLKTIGNGGSVANANGYDILFFEDPGLTTRLNWETERYVAATGEVIYWIKLPVLSSTVDTNIYMTYGNPAITTDQSTPTQVWDPNFKAVYHLNQATGANSLDSTTNNFSLTPTNSPAQVSGKLGAALDFNGTTQSTQNSGATDIINPLLANTISAWVYVRDFSYLAGANQRVFSMYSPVSNNAAQIVINTFNNDGNCFTGLILNGGTTTYYTFYTPTTLSINTWYHVAMEWDGGTTMTIYINGVSQSLTATSGLAAGQSIPLILGARYGGGTPERWFNGIIDEFKISNIQRSSGWIQTEYNNQNLPSTFYNISF